MRLRLLLTFVCVPLLLWTVLPLVSSGAPKARSAAEIQKKIETTREKIGKRKGTERVLTKDIEKYNRRISRLQGKIDDLNGRQDVVQADLDENRAELDQIQSDLRKERRRLTRLRARLKEAQGILAARLEELYKIDEPDLITVVLNSNGFADLLERNDFLRRINEQDEKIITIVKDAKKDATETEEKLDELEERQQKITQRIQEQRDEIVDIKQGLIDTRVGYDSTREGKANALDGVRAERKELEEHLDGLEKEQAKVQAALASPSSPAPSGSFKGSGGSLTMPTSGTFTSPFGQRWGRLHAGIDIAAPVGTRIVAADSGRVAIAGWTGGYGNYTCIQHTSSMSTCYGHQSSIGVSVGQGVKRGQTIGRVGNTGNSTGPHLHFEVRQGGNPVNPMGYL